MTGTSDATAGLSTDDLSLQVSADPRLSQQIIIRAAADPLLKTEVARACPVTLTAAGHDLTHDITVTSLHEGPDTVIAACAADQIELRLTWSRAPEQAVRLLIQARATQDAIVDGELGLSILNHLHPGDPDRAPAYDPGRGPVAADGRPLVRAGHYPLPRAWWSPRGGVAVLARMATPVWDIGSLRWATPPDSIPVRLRPEWLDVCDLTFMVCGPGWHGAVAALRAHFHAELDLDQYRRPDVAWYRDQWVQHFSFLYGCEIFDHTRGQLDIDRLLDDGERFGGYDGVLLWPAYPRIGVDERSQWDFYDDVPGGRAGLRAMTARARQRGTRVFIPYLPWDAPGECRHGDPPVAARELARVVADIEADGVFLDTIGAIPAQFRREIDHARPGVVFCSEIQPGLPSVAQITGSWDQAEHRHAGEIDLLRFLFPEHPSFVINRFAVGAHREAVIARALFNGSGLVVWQDVFGEVLPYTDTEAALVRATAATLRRHADCFRGMDARPLIPTAHRDTYANAFIAADGRAVVTIYNGSDHTIQGELLASTLDHEPRLGWAQIPIGSRDEPGALHPVPCGTVEPGGVGILMASPLDG